MHFITKINNEDITEYGLGGVVSNMKTMNYDTEATARVVWSFYTDAKEWGINDIGVQTTHVAIDIQVNIWGDENESDTFEVVRIDTEDDDWRIVDNIFDIRLGEVIIPQDIEIDFDSKTITISF